TTLHDGDTFTGSPSDVTYQPNANFNGTDSFTFKVTDTGDPAGCTGAAPACDAPLSSDPQTVNITVDPVNDQPTTSASPANLTGANSINEDAAATTVSLSGSDVETAAANLKFTVTASVLHGTLKQGATT